MISDQLSGAHATHRSPGIPSGSPRSSPRNSVGRHAVHLRDAQPERRGSGAAIEAWADVPPSPRRVTPPAGAVDPPVAEVLVAAPAGIGVAATEHLNVAAMPDWRAVDFLLSVYAARPHVPAYLTDAVLANVLQRVDLMAWADILHLVRGLKTAPYAAARAIAEAAVVRVGAIHQHWLLTAVTSAADEDSGQVAALLVDARCAASEICRLDRFLAGGPLDPPNEALQVVEGRHRALVAAALECSDRTVLCQADARMNGHRFMPARIACERQDSFAGILGATMSDRRIVEQRVVAQPSPMERFGREVVDEPSADARMFREEVGLAIRPEWSEHASPIRPIDLFGPAANPVNLERIRARVPKEYLDFIGTLDRIRSTHVLTLSKLLQMLAPFEVFATDARYAQHLQAWGGNFQALRWDLSSLQNTSPLHRAQAATALLAPARAEVERRITAIAVKAGLKVTG